MFVSWMFVSDEGFETLDLAFYIRSTPTFLYFDFYNFIRFFGNDKLTLNLKKKKKTVCFTSFTGVYSFRLR